MYHIIFMVLRQLVIRVKKYIYLYLVMKDYISKRNEREYTFFLLFSLKSHYALKVELLY